MLKLNGHQHVPTDGSDYACCSPLREDRSPSFSLFDGGRRWKDHGEGSTGHGDAADFNRARSRRAARDRQPAYHRTRPRGRNDRRHFRRGRLCSPFGDQKKAGQRANWPALETPTEEEIQRIAILRGLSPEGVALAAQRKFLYSADSQEGRTWIIAERACDEEGFYDSFYVAQARRLDGKGWDRLEGQKAWTLRGSIGTCPIGIHTASLYDIGRKGPRYRKIVIVEGGPDFLAAFDLILAQGLECVVHPVAMLGSSMHIDDVILPKFKGMQVKIFPHLDGAGQAAAQRWFDQLHSVAASVVGYSFEGLSRPDVPVTDLNDFAHLLPENPSAEELATMEALLRDAFTL